jgi:hypothetical protein
MEGSAASQASPIRAGRRIGHRMAGKGHHPDSVGIVLGTHRARGCAAGGLA